MQDCSDSIAIALELLQSCSKPMTCIPHAQMSYGCTHFDRMIPYVTIAFACDVFKMVADSDVIRDVNTVLRVKVAERVWCFCTTFLSRMTRFISNFMYYVCVQNDFRRFVCAFWFCALATFSNSCTACARFTTRALAHIFNPFKTLTPRQNVGHFHIHFLNKNHRIGS